MKPNSTIFTKPTILKKKKKHVIMHYIFIVQKRRMALNYNSFGLNFNKIFDTRIQ